MKRRKQRVSLPGFLRDGRFGPFTPRRECTPEEVMAQFGRPDGIEVHGPLGLCAAYEPGNAGCFPLIVAYGTIEFHFDTPTTLATLFCDRFAKGRPLGGPLKLLGTALLAQERPLSGFLALAQAHGLGIHSTVPDPPWSVQVVMDSGICLHFEHDDPDQPASVPTLRAFSWAHDFRRLGGETEAQR